MIKYEFKTLENIINNLIGRINCHSYFDNEDIKKILLYSQNEHINIKDRINDSIIFLPENSIRHYIQQHQYRAILLLNKIYSFINSQSVNSHINSLLKIEFFIIEDLLHFIENRYEKFCCLHLEINIKSRRLLILSIGKQIEFLIKELSKNCGESLNICLLPVLKQLNNFNYSISYLEVKYFKLLLRYLILATEKGKTTRFENEIANILIYLNFNSIYFVKYITDRIKNKVGNYDSLSKKKIILYRYLKLINQFHIKTHAALFPAKKSLKEYIIEWIFEEISFIEREIKIIQCTFKNNIEIPSNDIKIPIDLTVSQFACFIKVCTDSEIIRNIKREDLMIFFSQHFSSKYQETISQGSFRSKYFAITESVKADVKEILLKMIDQLRRLKTSA